MKRMIGICLILSFLIALSACSHPQSDGSGQEETAAGKVIYIDPYVGNGYEPC